ncbi:MAG: 3-deoxy-7-phosphoheptulonate synthase [Syntrophomonadaceae bacterium]|jgi:3-deoxy-7-phosphoheptulonate synthase
MNDIKLALRNGNPTTKVNINTASGIVSIGDGSCTVIAGPCSVESQEGYIEIALLLKELGVQILRGGAYKPRTSPYAFAGLGETGLKILEEARQLTGLPVVTEVIDIRDMDLVIQSCDMVQIGSRNMQNFPLLREAGRCGHPVVLKRGMAATIEEWLLAAEYILNEGNQQVVLCERGIRTFEPLTRNTLDINAVALLKEMSHLPVLVDPSHATGRRSLVAPVALAAKAAGADGIMVEVHQRPDEAWSDGSQSLNPGQFSLLVSSLQGINVPVDRMAN